MASNYWLEQCNQERFWWWKLASRDLLNATEQPSRGTRFFLTMLDSFCHCLMVSWSLNQTVPKDTSLSERLIKYIVNLSIGNDPIYLWKNIATWTYADNIILHWHCFLCCMKEWYSLHLLESLIHSMDLVMVTMSAFKNVCNVYLRKTFLESYERRK